MYFGENTISVQAIRSWMREFNGGRESISDQPHQGRPVSVTTPALNATVDNLICENRNISSNELYSECDAFKGTIFNIGKE